MSSSTTIQTRNRRTPRARVRDMKALVGSGDKIGRLTLPFLATGLALNIWRPALFSVGGPPMVLEAISAFMLIPGVTIWLWSAFLIVTRVPRHELITSGPFGLVKHPLYTAVALLVLPWVGFLLNTWLGVVLGGVLYVASRLFAREEEKSLSNTFGGAWDEYRRKVKIGWL